MFGYTLKKQADDKKDKKCYLCCQILMVLLDLNNKKLLDLV